MDFVFSLAKNLFRSMLALNFVAEGIRYSAKTSEYIEEKTGRRTWVLLALSAIVGFFLAYLFILELDAKWYFN